MELVKIGLALPKLPVRLEKVRDLVYFQGPLVSEFRAQNGDAYIYYWADADEEHHRWIVVRTSRRDLTLFVSGRLTAFELISSSKDGFAYLIDHDANGMLAR